jgi:NAD(P)-dependent dehydrogenase (short-subunit alcohol dehydrogenase family)
MKSVKEMFDLHGKVAIITGGAGLLGKKHAEAIAELGGICFLLDVNDEAGEKTAMEISETYHTLCMYYHCDITKEDQLVEVKNTVLEKYDTIDILINNAAIDPKVKNNAMVNLSRLENFMVDQWNIEVAVGLTGAMLCSKIFGYEMAKRKSGVIINISSDLGIIAPDQRLYRDETLNEEQQAVKPVTYSVIKHGLIGLTKYLATYWANEGIRSNTLCPAGVYNNQPDEFVERISNLIPMKRMANKDEYKGAIAFLASDASAYMNGATIIIDGGRSIL